MRRVELHCRVMLERRVRERLLGVAEQGLAIALDGCSVLVAISGQRSKGSQAESLGLPHWGQIYQDECCTIVQGLRLLQRIAIHPS